MEEAEALLSPSILEMPNNVSRETMKEGEKMEKKKFYIIREVRDEWENSSFLAEEVDNDRCVRSLPDGAVGTLIAGEEDDLADRITDFIDPEFSESVFITDSRRARIFSLPPYDCVITAIFSEDKRSFRITRIDPAIICPIIDGYSVRPMLFGSGFWVSIRINYNQQKNWQDIFLRVMLSL